ncbi:hypothetical protein MPPM_1592 [Methylorubrum populi]|uniref:Uncharacterized protein n=1 Tax=Methylorubrum populi TaxID=223967 RepID=A0A160PBI0_9HYPH|nr:hypothetical protein MPPM_1592 [Methylorubrum populi]
MPERPDSWQDLRKAHDESAGAARSEKSARPRGFGASQTVRGLLRRPTGYFVAATVTPSQSAGGGSRRKVSARST